MTKDKGRGVFATKPIKKGDLIFTEKPIATGIMQAHQFESQFADIGNGITGMMSGEQMAIQKKLIELIQANGIHALRVSKLFDGGSKDDLKIPSIEVYTRNNYKDHVIEEMSVEKLQKICLINSTCEEGRSGGALYCFRSFFNHQKGSQTLKVIHINEEMREIKFSYANHDIDQDDEITMDYIPFIKDQEERNRALAMSGIKE